jgi:heat shock protein HslJ
MMSARLDTWRLDRRAIAGLLIAVAICAGCDESLQPTSPTALLEREWRLIALDGRPVGQTATGEAPTLVFENSTRAAGFAGCNRFTASYERIGDRGLRFGAVALTRMACQAGMDVEGQYGAALERTRSFRLAADRLELFGDGGTQVAVFEPR